MSRRVVAIVQARMGSERLPGKVLEKIEGKPILEHIINALKESKIIDEITIATTINKEDLKIIELADRLGVRSFAGSESDVMDRIVGAARAAKADIIVRITGDDPLHDPDIIDAVIERHLSSGADYTSNVLKRTFPRGYDTEVFSLETLMKASSMMKHPEDREHVTPIIRDNPSIFRLQGFEAQADIQHSGWRLCVDTREDLALIQEIYRRLYKGRVIRYQDVIKLLTENPELLEMNAHVNQKSIKNKIY